MKKTVVDYVWDSLKHMFKKVDPEVERRKTRHRSQKMRHKNYMDNIQDIKVKLLEEAG